MEIKHIMQNGTVLDDISGHVVKIEESKEVYWLIDQIRIQEGEK